MWRTPGVLTRAVPSGAALVEIIGGQVADQIEVKNVCHEYVVDSGRVQAIRDINFTVGKSAFVCLVGPSGCGKTTILNILAGLLRPTSGEILIGDKPLAGNKQNRGVVFQ